MKCYDCESDSVEGKSRCAPHLARMRAYNRKYRKKPEVKEVTRRYTQMRLMIREYYFLLGLNEPSTWQMLRLEALAEYLGKFEVAI